MPHGSNTIEQIAMRITEWVGTPWAIIVHTAIFVVSLGLILFGVNANATLLVVTTAVSLEAIYLSIFIQMTVNRNTKSLEEVEEDIEEIQEGVKEIESDVDEISEDVEEISEDVDEISEDLDKIQERDERETMTEGDMRVALEKIQHNLQALLVDIEMLKKSQQASAHDQP